MGWLSKLLQGDDSYQSFDQELELVIARWTDRSRKPRDAMTVSGIVAVLQRKIDQLNQEKS